jgi:hypothetical protein
VSYRPRRLLISIFKVSQRGVVFFRDQNLPLAQQKRFVQLVSELSGKPSSSGLHVHPLFKSPDNEAVDAEGHFDEQGPSIYLEVTLYPTDQPVLVYVVSNRAQQKLYKEMSHRTTVTDAATGWHTEYVDILPHCDCLTYEDLLFSSLTFEPLPADYSCLILNNTPATGGDTVGTHSPYLSSQFITPPT